MKDFYNNQKIIEGLEILITKMLDRLDTYKDDNIDFAELIYKEGLGEVFESVGLFKEYEQYFKRNIQQMEKKINLLKEIKESFILKNLLIVEPCRRN